MIWSKVLIIIGAGDRGTSAAIRFFNCGFRPILVERENPTDLYYFRNFSDVVYQGEKRVDDIVCVYLGTRFKDSEIHRIQFDRKIPCISLTETQTIHELKPDIVIDCAGNFPKSPVLEIENFKCLIRIGMNFQIGRDGHYIIGDRGDFLGRILTVNYQGSQGEKENINTINAPLEGVFISEISPGERVTERQILGQINDINILAPHNGILAGILHSGHYVNLHQPIFKIITLQAFNIEMDLKIIPPANYSIAGGLLEAVMMYLYTEYKKNEREKNT